MATKYYLNKNVLQASKERISKVFDSFEKYYISFSGGKDSTVMTHLVLDEAIKRNKKVGLLIIDLEAQYQNTIEHIEEIIDKYKDNIDLHWFCGELLLRNAVSDFQPKWTCWDNNNKNIWVREKPKKASDLSQYDFYVPKMEFEEFMVLFGKWYAKDALTAGFIGIRSDESLHRYRAITSNKKNLTYNNYKWTTKLNKNLFNVYPIYDWRTEDIWIFHSKYKNLCHNKIYDLMTMAGVKLSNQRLCQPYGDDQKKGLWLYHILESDTWYKLLNRVSGVNSGSLYINEKGNINGYNNVTKPDNHTWESYCNYLLKSLPYKMQIHYKEKFKKFIVGWKKRGYNKIPDEAPHDLEVKCWAPSWKRMVRCILRNDYYCKGLGQTQPKSEAYEKYKSIKYKRKLESELK
jgi:predicted phosphoadenosine phosphosulfate sulfurtransferase|tara:strand:+ start:11964 stop:13175 length:1212 start_codon:yes stop_codon:yes gene_type:complete